MSRRAIIDACAAITKLEQVLSMHDLPSEAISPRPKISIGLVVYNGAEHIRGVLDSIVMQPYKNIELIVIDGGSMDGTQNVLNEYLEHISVLVSAPDKGIYDAMNKVCSIASGDWLIFLGCDDILLDKLGNITELMTDLNSVYYGDVIFRSSGNIYGGKFSKRRLAQMNFCHQAMFYPKSVYKTYSYSLDYKWLADYAYNLRLIGVSIPFNYLGKVVSVYNEQAGSSRGDAEFEKRKMKLIRASLGTTYALLEYLRRREAELEHRAVNTVGIVLRRLLPYAYWKYFQSLWIRKRKKY